jgi:hypothetical protein
MAHTDYVTGVIIGMSMICCFLATVGFSIPSNLKTLRYFLFGASSFFLNFVPNYIYMVSVEDGAPASLQTILETFVVATSTLTYTFIGLCLIYVVIYSVQYYKEKLRIRDEEVLS